MFDHNIQHFQKSTRRTPIICPNASFPTTYMFGRLMSRKYYFPTCESGFPWIGMCELIWYIHNQESWFMVGGHGRFRYTYTAPVKHWFDLFPPCYVNVRYMYMYSTCMVTVLYTCNVYVLYVHMYTYSSVWYIKINTTCKHTFVFFKF